MSAPSLEINTTQLFSRAALGDLWAVRTKFDATTQTFLDRLYRNMRKGHLQGQQNVTYKLARSRAAQLGYGRLYGSITSLEALQSECRATLCHDLYHDLDIVNCQPVLLLQIARRELDCDMPYLEAYVDNRDILLGKLIERDGVSRDDAKAQVIAVMYGQTTRDPLLMPLSHEVRTLSKQLAALAKYRELFDSLKSEKNIYGSFTSYLTQTAERECLLAMRDSLIMGGWSPDILAYDGLMIRRRTDAEITPEMLAALEAAVLEKTGYTTRIIEKPMTPFSDLPETAAAEDPLIDDLFAAKELVRLLADEITKQDGILYIYNPDTGLWEPQTGPIIAMSAILRFADKLIFKQGTGDKIKIYNYGGSLKNIRNMSAYLSDLVPASNFIRDSVKKSEGYLLFADGIYDMKAKTLSSFDKEKVFTARINRAFPIRNAALMHEVDTALFHAPFAESDVGHWYKNIIARALAGHTADKAFHVLLGDPNTGKSTVTNLLCKAFDGYVKTWVLDNLKFKAGSTTDEAKQLSWIAPLTTARIAISNEARMDNVKLDGNLAKRLSGGDAITYRQNFKDEVTQEIMTTFFAMGNDMPSFSPEDAALRVRMNYAEFKYTFVAKPEADCGEWEKPADPLLKAKVDTKDWQDAFIHVILDAYEGGLRVPAPESVKQTTDEHVAVESNSLKDLLAEEYEFAPEMGDADWVISRQIISYLRAAGCALSDAKIGRELSKMGLSRDTKKIGGKVMKVWRGIRT